MSKKSLLETNPFLKDPAIRIKIVETVTVSSSSIEGVHVAAEQAIKNVARKKMTVKVTHTRVSSSKPLR